uniref:DH domain-containing protein n=1 Tax=Latimeria chalumnae TaxID=7897 RepID=H2ZZX5_LATCH
MWKWYSEEEASTARGASGPQEGISKQSVTDITEQLMHTQQLVVQLKELIREKDNELQSKDQQLKEEKEAWEARVSKVKLQSKAKATSLNAQLEELKKQLSASGLQGKTEQKKFRLHTIKKNEELELQLSQKNAELQSKNQLPGKNASLQDMETLVQNLTRKVGESDEKYSLLQQQTESLKDLFSKEQNRFQEREAMYMENIRVFQGIIQEKEKEIVELGKKHEQELFRLVAKSDASADLEQLLKALKQKLHEKEEVLLGRTQVVDMLQKELDSRDQEIKEVNEKLKRLHLEKDNLQSKLEEKHNAELRDIQEKHETELSEKEQRLLQFQKELHQIHGPIERKGLVKSDMQTKQNYLQETVKKVLQEKLEVITSLEQRLQSVQQEAEEAKLKLIQELAMKDMECKQAKEQLSLVSKLNNESENLKRCLDKKENELSEQVSLVTQLKNEISLKEEQLSEYQKVVSELQKEKDELAEKTEQLSRLREEKKEKNQNENLLEQIGQKNDTITVVTHQDTILLLNSENENLKTNIIEINTTVSHKSEETATLQLHASQQSEIIVLLNNQIAHLNSEQKVEECVNLKMQLSDTQGSISHLKGQVETLTFEIDQLKSGVMEKDRVIKELNNYDGLLQQKEETLSDYQQKINSLQVELECLRTDYQKTVNQEVIDKINADKQQLEIAYKNQIQEKSELLRSVGEKLEASTRETEEQLTTAVEQMKSEHEQLQMQVSAKNEEVSGLKIEIQKLQQNLLESEMKWSAENSRANQQKNLLNEQLSSLDNEMKSKDVKILALQQDVDKLQEKLTENMSALQNSKDLLKEKEILMSDLGLQITDQKNQLNKLSSAILGKETELTELRQILSKKEKEVETLFQQLKEKDFSVTQIMESLSNEMVKFSEEKSQLASQLQKLENAESSSKEEVQSLSQQLQECKRQIEHQQVQLSTKEHECQELLNEKEQMRSQLEKMIKERDNVKKKLQAALITRKDLIKKVELEKYNVESFQNEVHDLTLKLAAAEEKIKNHESHLEILKQHLIEKDGDISVMRDSVSEKEILAEKLQIDVKNLSEKVTVKEAEYVELLQAVEERSKLVKELETLKVEMSKKEYTKIEMAKDSESHLPAGGSADSGNEILKEDNQKEREQLQKKLQAALFARKETIKKAREKERKQKEEYSQLLEKYNEQTKELESVKEKLVILHQEYQEDCDKLMKENGEQQYKQDKDAMLAEAVQLQNKVKETLAEAESYKMGMEQVRQEKETYSKNVSKDILILEDKNRELKKALEEANIQVAENSEEIRTLKQSLIKLQNQFDKETVQLQNFLKETQAKTESLMMAHETKEEVMAQPNHFQGEKVVLDSASDHITHLEQEIEKLHESIDEKDNTIKLLKRKLSEKTTHIEALELQLQKQANIFEEQREKMKAETDKLQKQTAENVEESKSKEQLQRKLQAALISRKEALKESKSLKNNIDALIAEKEEIISNVTMLEKSLIEMQSQQESLKVTNLSLHEEKEKLISEVNRVLAENSNLSAACESLKSTMQAIIQEKQDFSSQLSSLKDSQMMELSEWKAKHNELKQDYESLLQAYENISSEMDKMRQVVEMTKKEKQDVLYKLCGVESGKENLEKQIQESTEENEKLKDKMRKLVKSKQQRIQELEVVVERLANQLKEDGEKQLCQSNELVLQISQLEEENEELKEAYEKLQAALEKIQCEKEMLLNEVNSAKYALEDSEKMKESSLPDMQAETSKALSVNRSLSEEILCLKNEIFDTERALKTVEQEKCLFIEKLTQTELVYKESLHEKSSIISKLQHDIKQQQKEMFSLNEKVKILEDDKTLLQEELENVQELSEKVKNEKEYLETELLKNAEKIDQLTEMVRSLRQHNMSLASQLDGAKEEQCNQVKENEEQHLKIVREFEEKLRSSQRGKDGSKTKTRELQELLKEKQQEINQLQKDCIKYQELILDLERSVKISCSEQDKLKNEINSMTEKVSKSDKEKGNLEKELSAFKGLLDDVRSEANGLAAENKNFMNEIQKKEERTQLQMKEKDKSIELILNKQKALHTQELLNSQERFNVLEREKNRVEEEMIKLQAQVYNRDLQNKKLHESLNANLAKLAAFSQSMSSLQDDRDRVIDEAKKWEANFKDAIQTKENKIQEKHQLLQQLKEEIKLKGIQLEELQAKSNGLEQTVNQINLQHAVVEMQHKNELANIKENDSKLLRKLGELEKSLACKEGLIQSLTQKNKLLTLEVADTGGTVTQLETVENKLAEKELEFQEVLSNNAKFQADLKKQDAIIQQLKSLLNNKDAEISMLMSSRDGELSGYLEKLHAQHRSQVVEFEEQLKQLENEKECGVNANRELESKLKSIQKEGEKNAQEREKMAAGFEAFRKSMMSLQNDRDRVLSEYKDLEQRHLDMSSQKEDDIHEKVSENDKLKQEIRILLNQMDDLNSENALLKAKLIRYTEDLNQVLSLKDNQLKTLLKQQLDRIKDLENEKADVEKKYKEIHMIFEQQNESTNSLELKNESMEAETKTKESKLTVTTMMRQGQLEKNMTEYAADLKQKLQVSASECEDLKNQLSVEKAKTEELQNRLQGAQQLNIKKVKEMEMPIECDAHLKRNESPDERVVELARDLMHSEQKLLIMKYQNDELKSQNESFGKAMAALQGDRDKLIEDFKSEKTRADNAEARLSSLESTLTSLAKEKSVLSEKLSAFENKSTENQLIVQIENLHKTVSDKDDEITRLSFECGNSQKQMTSFSKAMASLQDDRERFLQEFNKLKRVHEAKQGMVPATTPADDTSELSSLRNNLAVQQNEKGRLLTEVSNLRTSEGRELLELRNRADGLEKALQKKKAFQEQTEQEVLSYQNELAELRTEKNLLLMESKALKQQYLTSLAEKDRQISELQQNVLIRESRTASSNFPSKGLENVALVGSENFPDQTKNLLAERSQIQNELQCCLQELFQRDQRIQQLNSKVMQLVEENTALSSQLKSVSHTLRDNQLHYNELQNRYYVLEREYQTLRATEARAEVPPGAPQEKASVIVEMDKLELSELRKRLTETEQLYSSTQQELSHVSESLVDERARRQAVEEALRLAEEQTQSFDIGPTRSVPREYSLQLDTEDEHEALIMDPVEHVVVRKMKGGALSLKRWLRGRSLYCSKLLTSRAKSRYLFLSYLLTLHVLVFMCLTGLL